MDDYDEEIEQKATSVSKKNNILPLWGNERTMNLNSLILTNIQSSHYFKVNLYELKTYHEVIDEIYYKVNHLEPWEKGSRKTAGQTGMCGGVRGVGAGGIVSTAFCLLYKLFTLKLSRKQVIGLITHPDSPYIRVLGFMYIRYTQPPADLWDWYDEYLEDEEEVDVRAGGGQVMTIGSILKNFLCKLEWYSTLFPRIPVPIQQKIEKKMIERFPPTVVSSNIPGSSTSRPRQTEDFGYSSERTRRSVSKGRSGFRDEASVNDGYSRYNSRENSRGSYERTERRKVPGDEETKRYRHRESPDRNGSYEKRSNDDRKRTGTREEYDKDYDKRRKYDEEKREKYYRKDHGHKDDDETYRREIDDIIKCHKEKRSREDEYFARSRKERDRSHDEQTYRKHRSHDRRSSSSYDKRNYDRDQKRSKH